MVSDVVERAILALREAAKGGPISVFIDPTLFDPRHAHVTNPNTQDEAAAAARAELPTLIDSALAQNAVRIQVLPPIHDNFDPQRQPYLLHLLNEEAAERLFNNSVRVALAEADDAMAFERQGRAICGWMIGVADPTAQARALAALGRIFRPDGTPWYLRWWDPRVCWHLPRVLPLDRQSLFRAALPNWWSLGPTQQLQRLQWRATEFERSRQQPADAAAPSTLPPLPDPAALAGWHIPASVWKRLLQVEPLNRTLRLMQEHQHTPSEAYLQRIESLFERCELRGFASSDDKVVFACAGIGTHPQFDEHPEVQRALSQAADVAQALASFDDDFWNNLRQGRWRGQQPAPKL
jgi:hypothetical protein